MSGDEGSQARGFERGCEKEEPVTGADANFVFCDINPLRLDRVLGVLTKVLPHMMSVGCHGSSIGQNPRSARVCDLFLLSHSAVVKACTQMTSSAMRNKVGFYCTLQQHDDSDGIAAV